jgi:hypothetical protein
MYKIDRRGNFLPYPGITVISKVDDCEVFEQIERILRDSEDLKESLSPLPKESYHVTICDIYSNYLSLEKILKNMDSWISLKKRLSNFEDIEWTMKMEYVYNKDTFGIVVKIPPELISLNNEINNFLGKPTKYVPHLTLGYFYNDILIDDDIKPIKEKIESIIVNKYVSLLPPKLCYFPDMTDFREI